MIKDRTSSSSNEDLKIKRAFGLLHCLAWYTMGINHRGPYVTVAEHFLNRPDIIIGLQKMSGKAMAESMG